jgi:RimJ/RimL family protein N-acetyltransferase
MRPCTSAPLISRLTEPDWRMFAELRLRALTDTLGPADPQYRDEITFTAAQWRRRLRAHAQFAAQLDDRLVGLIGAQRQTPQTVYLYSLWLEPTVRGRGVGHSLLCAAIDWARETGARTVTLRVDADNTRARDVYERLGFRIVNTGSGGQELMMARSLRPDRDPE